MLLPISFTSLMVRSALSPVVFLVCSGLGRVNRGYEAFFRQLFDRLPVTSESTRYLLYKGGGRSQPERGEFRLWNLSRKSWLGRRFGPEDEGAYRVEQLTFALALLPCILRHRPALIYFSDWALGHHLLRFRRLLPHSFRYKLVFRNGAPADPPYPFDYVQQLLPHYVAETARQGFSTENQVLIPNGLPLDATFSPVNKVALRRTLQLPETSTLLLSVGAANKSHKRMDYVIRSAHQTGGINLFLLLLGEVDEESAEVLALGRQLLGERFAHRRVSAAEVAQYYQAADVFVLASVQEGSPRVAIEALASGLPVLIHDYAVARDLLGAWAFYADFTQENTLVTLLDDVLNQPTPVGLPPERHQYAYQEYSWDALLPHYIELLRPDRSRKS